MKIDQNYLKLILNTFVESPRAFIWVADLIERGIKVDDKFLFHIQILEGQKFIEPLDKKAILAMKYYWVGNIAGKTGCCG